MKSILNSRRIKIIVDIFMTVFLILSFIRWEGDPTFHFVVGTVCTLFFATHVFIHRKWLKTVTKSYFTKTINHSLLGKLRVDILLILVWGVCIITGFLAVGYFVWGIEWMSMFGGIHGVTAQLGAIFTAIHIFQHKKQIISYIKGNQIIKNLLYLVLHILLHAVSIYLAVLVTIIHAFHHRVEIASWFKKRLFNHADRKILPT